MNMGTNFLFMNMGTNFLFIYGKTANDLIKEGKELMQENDVTMEEFKRQLRRLTKCKHKM